MMVFSISLKSCWHLFLEDDKGKMKKDERICKDFRVFDLKRKKLKSYLISARM